MVIDTETTGLPPRNANPVQFEQFNGCRLVEIAWQVYTKSGTLVRSCQHIVYPDGFTIPQVVVNIHGISTEKAMHEGVALQSIWELLAYEMNSVDTVVAHNLQFDDSIILAEMYRAQQSCDDNIFISNLIHDWLAKERKCTMKMACTPGKKWCKLVDLYKQFFNEEPEGTLHRADWDVKACARIYFHMIRT
jgi:hypothetical protein